MREDNPLIVVSMNMILAAGDARNNIVNALKAARENDFTIVETEIKAAEENINTAHAAQYKVIQDEMSGEEYETCILFTHAQDTLMTIMSELNMAKEMISMYKLIYEKLK